MPRVRAAVPGDAVTVDEITQAAYLPWVPRVGLRPAPLDADHAAAIAAGRVWVADRDGAPIGVLVVEPHSDHLLIENVAVLPAAHGTGIGTRLLSHAERLAAEQGLAEIRLFTHERMSENIAYYRRRGYVETHRTHEDGFDRVHFAKPIA